MTLLVRIVAPLHQFHQNSAVVAQQTQWSTRSSFMRSALMCTHTPMMMLLDSKRAHRTQCTPGRFTVQMEGLPHQVHHHRQRQHQRRHQRQPLHQVLALHHHVLTRVELVTMWHALMVDDVLVISAATTAARAHRQTPHLWTVESPRCVIAPQLDLRHPLRAHPHQAHHRHRHRLQETVQVDR